MHLKCKNNKCNCKIRYYYQKDVTYHYTIIKKSYVISKESNCNNNGVTNNE